MTAGRDRVVLAWLLLNAGQPVRADELIDAVWDDDPPVTARGQLQTCVSRLRRVLSADVIRTGPAGYRADVGDPELDAAVFARLVSEARNHPDQARTLLRRALDLWRGPALPDLDSPAVRRRAAVLDEQRAAVLEDWAERELAAGNHHDVVAELTGAVEEHPLRERLRSQLMLALYRVGRQADALAEYQRARALLTRELGVEPGRELREAHHRLLTGEVPAAAARTAGPVDALPRAVPDFTGRASMIERILASADAAGMRPHITVIDGMAGSGKTTLAVHLAGLLRDRYADAQLFLDLQGHSEASPVDPGSALVTLLRQLGLPAKRIPESTPERSLLWRSELAARKAVVVLDNAESTTQLTPLLPGEGAVLTLITSRRRLAGLDGIRPEPMTVLGDDEAVALLAAIAGDRVHREPAATAEVVRRCGGLPLAIRLAGSRLAHRPGWRVADLARRLGEAALTELAAEDRSVAGAFAVSYGQLPEPARRMFRLLGRQPVERFGAPAAAALAGCPLDEAQDLLDDLVDVHLVEEPQPGRYRLHDLIRAFAATLDAPAGERAAGLSGLIDFCLHASAVVARQREPLARDDDFPAEPPARPELIGPAAADPSWFEALRPYLLGLIAAAAEIGEHRRAWQLARSTWNFLFLNGYTDDLLASMHLGLDTAAASGDEAGTATMRNYLASGYYRAGRYAEAAEQLSRSIDYQVRVGNRGDEARFRANLGGVLLRQGHLHEADRAIRRSYDICRELRLDTPLAARLADLAMTRMVLGRDHEALALARRSVQLSAELRHQFMINLALMNVGQARLRLGHTGPARRLLTAALRVAREIGHRVGEVEITNELGRVATAEGRFTEAVEWHLAARQPVLDQGDKRAVAFVSNDLAVALRRAGDRTAALDLHRHALGLARAVGHAYGEGRSLAGIGVCLAGTDPPESRRHLRRALVIFTASGAADRADVQRWLDDGPPHEPVVPSRGTMGA